MLKDYSHLQQSENKNITKWFSDERFDLTIYEDNNINILKFELCYDKGHNEHAIIWIKSDTYNHYTVDDGKNLTGQFKMSPILVSHGVPGLKRIATEFMEAGKEDKASEPDAI